MSQLTKGNGLSRPVRFEADQRLGRITFDRPEAGNRVNVETMRSFISSLTAARQAGVDVLILGSSGSDFSLGRDQDEKPSGLSKRDNLALILDANELLTEFAGVTVAEVRGRALGFGSGVAIQCDFTIASENAEFGFTEILHGFAPMIVMSYLETYVNRKTALELLMTGRVLPAREGQTMGLVTKVVPDGELEEATASLSTALLDSPPDALRQCKFFLRQIAEVSPADRGVKALDALTRGG